MLVLAAACGGPGNGNPSAPAVQRVPSVSLAPGKTGVSRSLPPNWSVRMRVWFDAARSALRVSLGSTAVTVFDGSHIWHHVELSARGLVVDGRHSGTSSLRASSVTFHALHGGVEIRGLIIRRLGR